MLADHTDRHYALVANNQHPLQLHLYEYLNKKYRHDKEVKERKEGKSTTNFKIALDERVEQLINEKLKTLDVDNGEDITPEDISEIYREANEDVRAKMNLITRTRNKVGELEDYLEVRRPLNVETNQKI